MTTLEIILIAILAVENICFLIALIYKLKHSAPGGVKIKDGVRYTKTSEIKTDAKPVNISYNEKDVVLVADKVYTVGKDAEVKPGKYIILSTQEGKEHLTMRINDVCRNQKHGAEVVFAEGDIITAVNEPILLR
jgi:hypothetical protein